ncbi:MAG: hypothetical protein A2629_03155 [Candidatus Levybacteria bacterium RIFCSPHIGHO2_01_FULL_41_15]|nr:MAG: hypothetical protein A2629_03155 [Candidatus Levybacteria bacterium RIFCSPHIGHO2_01_FULL_41_15]
MAVGLFSVIDPVGQLQKSRDAERKSDLKELQKALELYYQDYGIYPSQTSYKILNLNWGNPWGPYLPTLPQDPSSTRKYIYYTPSDGQSYWLYASLEKTDDPQLCPNLDVTNKECPSIGTNITGYTVKSCGTSNDKPCNFGLSSPNTTP